MPLFKIEREKLKLINERPISLERDLQRITEENLSPRPNLLAV